MADLDTFPDYNSVENSARVEWGGKVFIFESIVPGSGDLGGRPLGRYKVFESRNPDLVGSQTQFAAQEPVRTYEDGLSTDPITGEKARTVNHLIDIESVDDIS